MPRGRSCRAGWPPGGTVSTLTASASRITCSCIAVSWNCGRIRAPVPEPSSPFASPMTSGPSTLPAQMARASATSTRACSAAAEANGVVRRERLGLALPRLHPAGVTGLRTAVCVASRGVLAVDRPPVANQRGGLTRRDALDTGPGPSLVRTAFVTNTVTNGAGSITTPLLWPSLTGQDQVFRQPVHIGQAVAVADPAGDRRSCSGRRQ